MSEELKPCPNPKCESGKVCADTDRHLRCWVECYGCGVCGPVEYNDVEAARLWNLLPRRRTTEVCSCDVKEEAA